jgi:hypothetical protein
MFQNIRIPRVIGLRCSIKRAANRRWVVFCVDPCSTTHNILFESRRSPTPPLTPHPPLYPPTSSFSYTLLVIISFPLCFHPFTTLDTRNRAGSQGGGAGDDPHVLSAPSSRTRSRLCHRDIRAVLLHCLLSAHPTHRTNPENWVLRACWATSARTCSFPIHEPTSPHP